MNRRNALAALTAATLLPRQTFAAITGPKERPEAPLITRRSINIAELGAKPGSDAAPIIQDAIDKLSSTGGVVYIPSGTYTVGRTLEWTNRTNARAPGILFQGDSPHSSILRSTIPSGPLLRVRGVPVKGPISTTFFWGGGVRDLGLQGTGSGEQDGLEILGWYYGEIFNAQISGFGRHGIRTVTDLAINPNPDFSSCTLFVRGTVIQRCGGWGFIDDGGPQGAPAWSWDRTIFALCREGGAQVQSSSHGFTKCSFAGCGWQSEGGPPATRAYGLYFTGGATATSRQWVEGCEFDTNLTAHIGARFLTNSSFWNNRFIFNDRYKMGRLCPESGVELGAGDAKAAIRAVEFRQSVFRFDRGGQATGFDWANTANVRDVDVSGSVFLDNTSGALKLLRYRGHDARGVTQSFGYSIRDRE